MCAFLGALSRGLGRRRHTFTLTPLSDLSVVDGGWISTGTSPQFQLIPLNGRYPVGWVLFETRVIQIWSKKLAGYLQALPKHVQKVSSRQVKKDLQAERVAETTWRRIHEAAIIRLAGC